MAEHHKYGTKSKKILSELHPDLAKVMVRALELSKYDIGLTEGARTQERQKQLLEEGATTTLNSEHFVREDGHAYAVDFIGYKIGKNNFDPSLLRKIAGYIFQAAFELNVPIEWGGHWESFSDMPHIQLAKWRYPK